MLIARNSRLVIPSSRAVVFASSICRTERSIPTNRLCGSASAIGMRLPPAAQPSSSTRQREGGAGVMPNSVATVARRSGRVCGKAPTE
jgi:hypothetical protein